MKNRKSLYKIFFLSSLCLVPYSGVHAESVFPSEGLVCEQFLDKVKVKFNVNEEKGAVYEYRDYINPNNPDEIGYRSCTTDCSITFAGKCRPDLSCDDFVENDLSCNLKVGDETITQNEEASCGIDVPVSCKDYINELGLDLNIDSEKGIKCEKEVNVDPESCKISVTSKCERNTCTFYRANVKVIGTRGVIEKFVDEEDLAAKNLSCLADEVSQFKKGCERDIDSSDRFFDDCVITGFYRKYHTLYDSKDYSNYFYLDNECKVVKKPEGEECGRVIIQYIMSPISLIFEKDLDINSDVSFVNFDLDPSKKNSWYTWKASDKAPLLVYDPEHTGKINSAYQLFGEWAFGGKQNANLSLKENLTIGSKWENGYEALASLDRDFDGKLSGAELNELGLWFDGNRDAISQEGEVVSLKEAGITVLYVNGYKEDANGDLRLELGYERKVGDEIIRGASVDWYGKGADSKMEIVEAYRETFTKPNLVAQEETIQDARNSNNTVKADVKQIDASDFRDVWDYFIDGDEKYATPNGYLILGEGKGVNSIKGHSIVERIFTKSPDNKYHSYVGVFKLNGNIEMTDKNEKMIAFSVSRNGLVNNTTAKLSSDKKTLIGTTKIVLEGELVVANYTWKAVRHGIK